MKRFKLITCLLALGAFISFQACEDAPGIGGNGHIHGTVVEHHTTAASDGHDSGGHPEGVPNATVLIWYGQADDAGAPDNQTVTDISGGFEFEGLNKGNYFLYAEAEDDHDGHIEIKSGTASAVINMKAEEIEVEIEIE